MSDLITTYFEADHKRLDSLYLAFKHSSKESDSTQAVAYFMAYKEGIEKHIVWEESVLFPFFEQQTGMLNGPTRVMTMEHQQVYRLNEAILACIEQKIPSEAFELELEELLAGHNHKEENILYPMIDNNSNESQKAKLLLDIASLTNKP
ncbi:hemerythrin domain-containing protein [Pseudoalteromonas haloplanktis]|uniref:Hemerythrin domain-containing protein n=1 Tax=Pseudoalteromonas haloplanktis TaxID=228 RepID=A0ABU1B9H4_PSEHA|nr:hemerythrin domain-containing protein [Pseudoalteromonas haloplanktis]MDQ9090164.1 hemerythrin domain-containing protein [Pseudoalteromonas haloplanktis]